MSDIWCLILNIFFVCILKFNWMNNKKILFILLGKENHHGSSQIQICK